MELYYYNDNNSVEAIYRELFTNFDFPIIINYTLGGKKRWRWNQFDAAQIPI